MAVEAPASQGWIGRAVPRKEDRRLLLGAARFVADVQLPDMVEMHVVRSPHGHARLRRVDGSALGGRALDFLAAADLPGPASVIPINWILPSMHADAFPTLARDRVHYVGEPVAALVAASRYAAEDAADAVVVEYEPLPAVVDVDEALAPDAPLLHPDWGSNVAFQMEAKHGDVEGAFASADLVIRQRIEYPRHHPLPVETRGVVAHYDAAAEQLVVWLSTQATHVERTMLAERLALPEHRVRVITPQVGGAFGCKLHIYPEEILACLLALRTGRPVRWIEDRREHLLATIHAREQRIDIEVAARQDGTMLGVRARIRADVGAYLHSRGPSAATVTMHSIPGPYQFRGYEATLHGVVTNKMPFGAYRGFGKPQATLAMERCVDALAARLGLDPAEVRRRNLVRPDQMPYPNIGGRSHYDSGDYPEALRRALTLVNWDARRAEHAALREGGAPRDTTAAQPAADGAPRFRSGAERADAPRPADERAPAPPPLSRGRAGVLRGLGLACTVESTALSSPTLGRAGRRQSAYESTAIRVDPTGAITLASSLVPSGQGHETVLAQIAASELGVHPDQVRVILGDSDLCPYSGYGTAASRGMTTGGASALLAARQVRDRLLALAGHLLEAAPDDLDLADGEVVVRGNPTRRLGFAEIACQARLAHNLPPGMEPGLDVTVAFDPPQTVYAYATNACEVEVDPETGVVTLLQYVAVDDSGTVVNPMIVDGQLHGGIAQSIGGALLEELRYDEHGQLLTASLMDYLAPTACEVPWIHTAHLETPSPYIPGGFKGVGEAGTVAVPAAIANAVLDALRPADATVIALPLTPERVRALAQRSPFVQPPAP